MTDSNQELLVYGPVPSRRLGRSLGIDLIPLKLCSYDCIYCQLGKSSSKTVTRRPYRKADDVLHQLEARLAQGVSPDCITIAGSGEPTLNSDIGKIISQIKKITPVPVALLTNGSLLSEPEVRDSVMGADIVIPSLDACTPEQFLTINRPHRLVTFDKMTEGIITFADEYTGQLWLEIFIMEGINASVSDALAFKPLVDRISPDVVYVNTAVRPPADPSVKQASEKTMADFYTALGRQRHMDVTFEKAMSGRADRDIKPEILQLASRRPVTVADMAAGLGISENTAKREAETLLDSGLLQALKKGSCVYFRKTLTDGKKQS